MERIKESICKFDMFPAPATLRSTQQKPETGSIMGGLISCALICVFLYFFMKNLVSTAMYNSISSDQTETRILNNSMSAADINFALMINQQSYQKTSQFLRIRCTLFLQNDTRKNITLETCKSENWKQLGDNYEKLFNEYDLGNCLCPVESSLLDIQGVDDKYSYILISVNSCLQYSNENLDLTDPMQDNTSENITLGAFGNNNTINSTNDTTNNANTTANTTTNNTTTTTNTNTNNTNNSNNNINNTTGNNTTNTTNNNTTNNSSNTNNNNNSSSTDSSRYQNCLSLSESKLLLQQIIGSSRSMIAELFFLDRTIDTSSMEAVKYFINNDNRVRFTVRRGVERIIEIATYKVHTDTSFWPISTAETIDGYIIDKAREYDYVIEQIASTPFVTFSISMNRRRVIITRSVGKFDEILSYYGGLFDIIISFMSVFLISYNKYRYELQTAQSCFNYDVDGGKVKEEQFGFFMYIKYSLYEWMMLFTCCKGKQKYKNTNSNGDEKGKEYIDKNQNKCETQNTKLKEEIHCKKISETREEVVMQMDVVKLLRKIKNLDSAILYLIGRNQMISSGLLQPPTMDQVKDKRIAAEYYQAVIQGKPALTVQDINQDYKFTQNPKQQTSISNMLETFQQRVPSPNMPIDRSNILEIIYNNFPQQEQQARETKLSEQLLVVELKLAQAFYSMKEESKVRIVQKIPIKILHRFRLRMQEVNSRTAFHIDF